MKFEVSANLKYKTNSEGTLILAIKALKSNHQNIINESFNIDGTVGVKDFEEAFTQNRLTNLSVITGESLNIAYQALVNTEFRLINVENFVELNLSQLSPELLTYLHPSRYCQSDKLYRLANNKFGNKPNDFEKVTSLTNWIHKNVQYLSGSTNSQTSAYDTVTEQAGVCRDFAHLGIALCRALTIPARYFTGYAYQLYPQDFHACFEAYIDGKWLLFDATRLIPLNAMVKIATGRDAADAAVANIFGDIDFVASTVNCQLADDNFTPFYPHIEIGRAISYL